jgi:NAD(P)-dependent dehydrogenase (short-subunit alcohol dehydrogenase family)
MDTVLITGASSGIGRACALKLAAEGFKVFAGVRGQHDGDALRSEAHGSLHPVLLDVGDARSVENAVRAIEEDAGRSGLAGLVDNAGIGYSGPLEYFPIEDMRRQFEVNVLGPVAVTQAFLPLIRRARGRIVNMGSVGDRITMPFGGPLCASKIALATLTEAMRLELRPWGIHVCLIEPGSIATPAVEKFAAEGEKLLSALPPEGAGRYGEMFREFLCRVMERERAGSPPDVVATAVLTALTANRPRTRYVVGKHARFLTQLAHLPDRWLDGLRLRLFGLPTAFGALAPRSQE